MSYTKITYFDLVVNVLFAKFSSKLRILSAIGPFLLCYFFWTYIVFGYFNFINNLSHLGWIGFSFQLWIMLFIASSVFVPYWILGWWALIHLEKQRKKKQEIYSQESISTEAINYHKKHLIKYRTMPWIAFLVITIIFYLLPELLSKFFQGLWSAKL